MNRSAFSCIGPAWERMAATCFRPFRFGIWARLALIAFLAAEVGGGGFNFNKLGGRSHSQGNYPFPPVHAGPQQWTAMLWLGAAIALIGLVIFLVFAYLNARARFVLMDAAVERTCRLRFMWERWREPATRYFGFNLVMTIVGFALLLFAAFQIIRTLWRLGVFAGVKPGFGEILSGLVGPIFLVLSVGLLLALVNLFAKDFLVPVMGFEGRTVVDGWERLRTFMAAEPAEFIIYVITKILLAIAAWFVRMMLFIPVVIVFAIPVAVMIAVGMAIGKGSMALGTMLAIVGALFLAPLLLFVIAMINVPFAMFFESYALEFIGGRLPGLEAALHPLGPYAPVDSGAPAGLPSMV